MTQNKDIAEQWLTGKRADNDEKKISKKKKMKSPVVGAGMNPYEELEEVCYGASGTHENASQELVYRCLKYAVETKEPLPYGLICQMYNEMEILVRGYESKVFRKSGKKPSTHPDDVYIQREAVAYIKTCRRTGLDSKPVETIMNKLGVSRSTVYSWLYKHTDARDDLIEFELMLVTEYLGARYRGVKPPPILIK